jgi:hypothetical protein
MAITDAERIALVVALVVILVAAAFALNILFRRLPNAGQVSLMEGPTPIGPIGFVHF